MLSYKFATLTIFLAILAPYWITYSGVVQILNDQGKYEKAERKKDSCCQKVVKVIFLTFLGPFVILLMQGIQVVEGVVVTVQNLLSKCFKIKASTNCQDFVKGITNNFVQHTNGFVTNHERRTVS